MAKTLNVITSNYNTYKKSAITASDAIMDLMAVQNKAGRSVSWNRAGITCVMPPYQRKDTPSIKARLQHGFTPVLYGSSGQVSLPEDQGALLVVTDRGTVFDYVLIYSSWDNHDKKKKVVFIHNSLPGFARRLRAAATNVRVRTWKDIAVPQYNIEMIGEKILDLKRVGYAPLVLTYVTEAGSCRCDLFDIEEMLNK